MTQKPTGLRFWNPQNSLRFARHEYSRNDCLCRVVLHSYVLYVHYTNIWLFFFFIRSQKWHICQFRHILLIISNVWLAVTLPSIPYLPAYMPDHNINVAAGRNGGMLIRLDCTITKAWLHNYNGLIAQLQRLRNAFTKTSWRWPNRYLAACYIALVKSSSASL